MQISVADVDANGRALGTSTSFALCGQVRSQGESDDSLNRLATKEGRKCTFLTGIWLTDLAILKCSGMYGHTKNNGSQLEESICPYVHCYHISFVPTERLWDELCDPAYAFSPFSFEFYYLFISRAP